MKGTTKQENIEVATAPSPHSVDPLACIPFLRSTKNGGSFQSLLLCMYRFHEKRKTLYPLDLAAIMDRSDVYTYALINKGLRVGFVRQTHNYKRLGFEMGSRSGRIALTVKGRQHVEDLLRRVDEQRIKVEKFLEEYDKPRR